MNLTERPFKIAFVGTSCIGKTSLIEYFRKKYALNPAVVFVEEAATIFFRQHPEIVGPARQTVEFQAQIQALQIELEKAAYAQNPRVIFTDRSALDAAAYVWSQGNFEGADELLDHSSDWIITYSLIYLLDPEGVPFQNNEVRNESVEDRQLFHQAFLEMFRDKQIAYVLLSGTLEERIRTIENILIQFESQISIRI